MGLLDLSCCTSLVLGISWLLLYLAGEEFIEGLVVVGELCISLALLLAGAFRVLLALGSLWIFIHAL